MVDEDRRPTPRRLWLALAAAVVVAAVAALIVLLGGDDDPGGSAAAPSSTSAVEAEPSLGSTDPGAQVTPPAEDTQAAVDELPPSLPAVPLDQPAAAGDGVTATIDSIEAIDGAGEGRGNVSGPALRVTVRIANGTAEPVDLAGVAVDLTHGSDPVPASPLNDPSQTPFSGSLAPGATAQGVYVFSVPQDDRETVTISVGHRAGAPYMVFTGPAA